MNKRKRKKSVQRIHVTAEELRQGDEAMRSFFSQYDGMKGVALERRLAAQAEYAREGTFAYWDIAAPRGKALAIRSIDPFDARGMRCIYGRGDGWPRRSFHMDVWSSKDGRVFARFWSRSKGVPWQSYEVFGLKPVAPDPDSLPKYSERNVPGLLRFQYDQWIVGNS
jgi:hypothetical protein